MAVSKRLFWSRRQQFMVFVILLVFVAYFVIYHEGTFKLDQDLKRESVIRYVENTLEEALKEDKGTGCNVPKTDPFDKEVTQFNKNYDPVNCPSKDWVKCYMSKCKVVPEILSKNPKVKCRYRDIIYETDYKRRLGPIVVLEGGQEYELRNSDFVKIYCTGSDSIFFGSSWSGHGAGFRSSIHPKKPPPGRENTVNVLIFGFDSTSKNGFIRKMPKSYKVLTEELGFTVLNAYNIVGDGTPAALFPIMTGKTELELPEARKSIKNSGHMDQMPFIFYKLKEDGYRTAYFEDSPAIGTFQYRFNGWKRQPADHFLRAFYMETGGSGYCVGDTPRYKLMMNITEQFLKQDGKRYIFTFIADITHDDFNRIGEADVPTVDFLRRLQSQGVLENTLVFVMGDHGPRYANVRDTFQGKLEERLPLMAIRIPEVLKKERPDIQSSLELNADVLTTPHDIYATVLDAIDMTEHWNRYKVKGADSTRGLTLFEPIPRNRSCSEAAIEPHWCTCLKWDEVPEDDPLYKRVADALVDHINSITESVRHKCVLRTLSSIQWLLKRHPNKAMLLFETAKDNDGYIGKFRDKVKVTKEVYNVKLTVGPGTGVYEAAVTHHLSDDNFNINTREISRISAYNDEPSCISDTYPHMNMYCYCAK